MHTGKPSGTQDNRVNGKQGSNLDITAAQLAALFEIDPRQWRTECDLTAEYFSKFGEHVPAEMYAELVAMRRRLSA